MDISRLTTQEKLDLYYLIRNMEWRYRLDDVDAEVAKHIARLLSTLREELYGQFITFPVGYYKTENAAEILALVDIYAAPVKQEVGAIIRQTAGAVGAYAIVEQAAILGLGGRAKQVQGLSVEASRFEDLLATESLGGKLLGEWVDSVFESGFKAKIQATIDAGVLQGEGYPKLLRDMLKEGEFLTKREATTLVRTYVQSASVTAQEVVYQNNKDLLQGLKWSAVMEQGYVKTGRGTCPRCAALDGKIYGLDEKKPPCPLHPRCRCLLLPVVDWEKLGLPELAVDDTLRPFALREEKNIDAGGRREIYEVGFHQGDWGSWASGRSDRFKINSIGPERVKLWKESGLPFDQFVHKMVNRQTGELYTLDELKGKLPTGEAAFSGG